MKSRLLCILLLLCCGTSISHAANGAERFALLLVLEGVIGPASSDYILRNLEKRQSMPVDLVILKIDTPGGLDSSMREIIKGITMSNVPIVTYVYPPGARATSAGTYILYASHVAAMAPGTNAGAATPVQMGGLPGGTRPPTPTDVSDEQNDQQDKLGSSPAAVPDNEHAMRSKVVNDAVAYIRSLADLRGRNAEWAEKAVRESASIEAEQALKLGVIDIIANDVQQLLKQLHGRKIELPRGEITLNTETLQLQSVEPDWRNRLLAVITNPNVAYILMLIGIYGLIFEFANPGAMVPGTIGGISLLMALYAFQVLPINYAGLALILFGVALMVGEAFVPSFGVLGVGGVVAFVIGSIILIDTDVPGFGISPLLIFSFGIVSALLLVVVIALVIKARKKPVVSGMEELLGSTGVVLADFQNHQGRVRVHGEIWTANAATSLKQGQTLRVTAIEGLTLTVEPCSDDSKENSK